MRLISPDGEPVAEYPRAYGSAPTDPADPASQLPLLICEAGGWVSSQVRAALPSELRSHLDSLPRDGLRDGLRALLGETERTGWASAVAAAAEALAATGRVDEATVHLAAGALAAEAVQYDKPVDLSVYDGAFEGRRP